MSRYARLCLAAFCFALSACVTINVYFPAAAVEKAADNIVEDVFLFAAPAFGACQVSTPEFSATSIKQLGYGGSPIAPELIRHTPPGRAGDGLRRRESRDDTDCG